MEAPVRDDEIFVYMGGDQRVPNGVRRARIHKSVKIVRARAFQNRQNLISVEFHDGVEIIEEDAFDNSQSLSGSIKLLGIRIVKDGAFCFCRELTGVQFGDNLETIEVAAFYHCTLLRRILIPTVRHIKRMAFAECEQLTELDLPEGLETIEYKAFTKCFRLGRISMPLKDDMIEDLVFNECWCFTRIDLVGGIHETVASLHLESWRNEMKGEINRINQVLPYTVSKTLSIRLWMRTVIIQLNHYTAKHHKMLKEATTLLELALWKANLGDNEGGALEKEGVRTRRQRKRARKEIRITTGANIVIKNVLPFLELK